MYSVQSDRLYQARRYRDCSQSRNTILGLLLVLIDTKGDAAVPLSENESQQQLGYKDYLFKQNRDEASCKYFWTKFTFGPR